MKSRIALLPVTAFLSLVFLLTVTVYADVIDVPPFLDTGAAVVLPIILVAVLVIATVLIIRKLKK
ncbi:MAG: hypothetical protein M0R40_11000 [Firmicutes bacterium]|nr:hypothetical protein [Bacillota bacterium]